jgi:hypothetical protein
MGEKNINSILIYLLNTNPYFCFDNPEIIKYKFATNNTVTYDTIDNVSVISPDVVELD